MNAQKMLSKHFKFKFFFQNVYVMFFLRFIKYQLSIQRCYCVVTNITSQKHFINIQLEL